MAHIAVPPDLPGIIGLLAYRPETARPLSELAQVLLRGVSTLSAGERELIAAYVSHRNECYFCSSSHSAAAKYLLDGNKALVEAVKNNVGTAPVSEKLKALLRIAGKVQMDGRTVTETDVQQARALGATDQELHDTVLIAAAFCMYNRYVDGLATWTPREEAVYDSIGKRLAREGYGKG
ncbi:MAG: peroxidase-related enzyme [Ignavibacteriae bacterium]|nr:peroxidase-related enzyme [Ignavibacteriota bacterium]